jgi:hypothetical protein
MDSLERIYLQRLAITAGYTVKRSEPLNIFKKSGTIDGENTYKKVFSISVPENLNESLLLLSKTRDGKYRGTLLPFSEARVHYNAVNCFNFTPYPVVAEIANERIRIPPGEKRIVNYPAEIEAKPALQSRFVAKVGEEWNLVQAGFIPIVKDARILFIISSDAASTVESRNKPLRFTHVYEVLREEEERRRLDASEYHSEDNPNSPDALYGP